MSRVLLEKLWTEHTELLSRLHTLEQNHATQERLIEEIRLGQRSHGDQSRQTAEAGCCDRLVDATESQVQEQKASLESPDGIYLAGPMSGYHNHNFDRFNEVARRIRSRGYRVVNPAELNPEKPGYAIAMRRDVAAMLTCHRIMLLPGWERSKGATCEFQLAVVLEMQINYWEAVCNLF